MIDHPPTLPFWNEKNGHQSFFWENNQFFLQKLKNALEIEHSILRDFKKGPKLFFPTSFSTQRARRAWFEGYFISLWGCCEIKLESGFPILAGQ